MRTRQGDKKNAILQSAISVFGSQGFSNAKIQHIAQKAGIASGTVYLYFENKEEILDEIITSVWEALYEILSKVEHHTELNPAEKISAMIDGVFDFFISKPLLALVFVNEHESLDKMKPQNFMKMSNRALDTGESVMRDGVKNGFFKKQVNPKIFRIFIFGGLRNILMQWANDTKGFPLSEIRENIKMVVQEGIIVH